MSRKVINVVQVSSNIKYYDISSLAVAEQMQIVMFSIIGKYRNTNDEKIYIDTIAGYFATVLALEKNFPFLAIGIDFNLKRGFDNELSTIREVLELQNLYDTLLACPELTEEQFYDLTLPTE